MAEKRSERFPLAWVTGGILLALAVAVAILRFDRLDELPPPLYFDEAAHGVDAVRVLKGEHKIFFPENNGREGLIVYAVALATSLLGRTVLAIRLPTALASAGTVFVVFWLGRLLFGRNGGGRATPWRGLFIGAVGAGLMAVSLGQTILGRTAFRANFLPLLLSLCFALLWWGWPKPRPLHLGAQASPRQSAGSATAEPGGGSPSQALAPGCCCTLILQRGLPLCCFLVWLELFPAPTLCHRARSAARSAQAQPATGRHFCGRGWAGSCADAHLLRSSSRTIFFSKQSTLGLSTES